VGENRKFRVQAANEITLHCLRFKGIDFQYADYFLNQLSRHTSLAQLARTQEITNHILLVFVPRIASDSLLSMIFHRLDLTHPSLIIRFFFQQHPQGHNAIQLDAGCTRIGQIEKFAFGRSKNLALALMSGKFAQFQALLAERPRTALASRACGRSIDWTVTLETAAVRSGFWTDSER
jgi:hypothetical protein